MNCPRCGNEMRRSKKDPDYGLCDNCRKKFKWPREIGYQGAYEDEEPKLAERPPARRRTQPQQSAQPRQRSKKNAARLPARFKTPRLVIGIISMLLFVLISLQSCLAGLGNALSANGEVSGSAGFLLSVFMLAAGIVTVCMRKRESTAAFISPGILYLAGAVLAAANVGSYKDLTVWAILAAIFSAMHILFMFLCKGSNIVFSIAIPLFIIALVVGFTVISGTGSDDKDSEKTTAGNTQTEEPAAPAAADNTQESSIQADGTVSLDNPDGTLIYKRHEITTDYAGNPALLVYFDYTNKKESPSLYYTTFSVNIYQNGAQCQTAISGDSNEAVQTGLLTIEGGATVEIGSLFSLKAETGSVTLNVQDISAENIFNDVHQQMELTLQ